MDVVKERMALAVRAEENVLGRAKSQVDRLSEERDKRQAEADRVGKEAVAEAFRMHLEVPPLP